MMRHTSRSATAAAAACMLLGACTSTAASGSAPAKTPTSTAPTAPPAPTAAALSAPDPGDSHLLTADGTGDKTLPFIVDGQGKVTIQVDCVGTVPVEVFLYHDGSTTPDRDVQMNCLQIWSTAFNLAATAEHRLSIQIKPGGQTAWNILASQATT